MSSRVRGDSRAFDILLVEENPEEIAPFIYSFEATELTNEVHVIADTDEALDYIHRRGEYSDVPRPDLILLNLHVAGGDGEDVLVELNEQPPLHRIPVLVFTASDTAEDIAKAYELNANAYLQRPNTAEAFDELAQAIEDFWLKIAHLPPSRT